MGKVGTGTGLKGIAERGGKTNDVGPGGWPGKARALRLWSESKSSGISKKPLKSRQTLESLRRALVTESSGQHPSKQVFHDEELLVAIQTGHQLEAHGKENDTGGQGVGATAAVLTHQKEEM